MLRGPSGHYAEFVRAVAARADGVFSEIRVVADPRARDFLPTLGGTVPVLAAPPAAGTLAELAAIGASLRAGSRTLVLTANASHALAADWLSFAGSDALARLSLFVHWPLSKPSARLALALGARTRRRALFLAPTRGVRGMLEAAGMGEAASEEQANVLVFNTCTIREKADDRLVQRLHNAKNRKSADPDLQIIVAGCWAESTREAIFRDFPWVDAAVGPGRIGALKQVLESTDDAERGAFGSFDDFAADLPKRQRCGGQVGVLDEKAATVEVDACALSRDDCGGKCGHALTRQAREF
jgi:hypothetical protein